MSFLVLRAYLMLVYFDLYLIRGNFSVLYKKVREYPMSRVIGFPTATERVCAAMDIACIWYWKEVLCLQRSAATACLLRGYGIADTGVVRENEPGILRGHLQERLHGGRSSGGRVVPWLPREETDLAFTFRTKQSRQRSGLSKARFS